MKLKALLLRWGLVNGKRLKAENYGIFGIKRAAEPFVEGMGAIWDVPIRYTTLSRDDEILLSEELETEDLSRLYDRHVFISDIMLAGGDSFNTALDILLTHNLHTPVERWSVVPPKVFRLCRNT